MWLDVGNPCSKRATGASNGCRYPTFEEALKVFHNLRAETLKVLDPLSDDDLDRPSQGCPPEWKAFLGTYTDCFRVIIFNTMHHRGQVADARRAAGRKPLRM